MGKTREGERERERERGGRGERKGEGGVLLGTCSLGDQTILFYLHRVLIFSIQF